MAYDGKKRFGVRRFARTQGQKSMYSIYMYSMYVYIYIYIYKYIYKLLKSFCANIFVVYFHRKLLPRYSYCL